MIWSRATPDRVTAYAKSVVSGKRKTGRLEYLACQRHLNDLKNAVKKGWLWDVQKSEKVVNFFPACLRHSKGEWNGAPCQLEPWQCFVIGSVFGWKVKATGLRRFRGAYVSIGRKNGKSTLAAGLGIWVTGPEGESGAQNFVVATKEDQARMVFNEACAMLRRSPVLSDNGFQSFRKSITFKSESFLQPLGRDSKTHDGFNPFCLIADEVHAMRDRTAIEVIESGMGARREPLSIYITTRGEDFPGICKELDDLSIKVLQGVVEADNHFAYIAALDEGDAWDDPTVWHKANPNLGVSVKPEYLQEQCEKAKLVPARQIEFKRKHCNQWTGSQSRWLDIHEWQSLPASVDDDEIEGVPCYAGLDLSGKLDLTAFVRAYRLHDGTVDLRADFWLPGEGLADRERAEGIYPWQAWAEAGYLRLIPGRAIDYDYVVQDIAEILSEAELRKLAFDRWKIAQFEQSMARVGVDFDMLEFGQGFKSMSPAVEEFEALFTSLRIRHPRNPILTMCVANAVAQTDPAGNKKLAKDKSAGRIDGIVAAVMAVGAMSGDVDSLPSESVYEQRGFTAL